MYTACFPFVALCDILGEVKLKYSRESVRDRSFFMPKGGSVIFKQFRHMKNLPLPGSGYFKKLPRVYDRQTDMFLFGVLYKESTLTTIPNR